MVIIVPAIIAKSFRDLQGKVRIAETFPTCRWVQIDIMDGKFVPARSVSVRVVSKIRTPLHLELHLMVTHPEEILDQILKTHAGRVIVHAGSSSNLHGLFDALKQAKIKGAIALNPENPVAMIKPYLTKIDSVLLLSVQPGSYGAKFLPSVYGKIRAIRKMDRHLPVAIDGGVSLENAVKLIRAGADRLSVGSRIFLAEDPRASYRQFKNIVS